MPDVTFDTDGYARFPTKYDGEVTLSKWKWDRICEQPERFYYRLNGEKLATTLINPDEARVNSKDETQAIYYKKFDTVKILQNVEGPNPYGRYWGVVVNTINKRICTVMPMPTPKKGKEYKGRVE